MKKLMIIMLISLAVFAQNYDRNVKSNVRFGSIEGKVVDNKTQKPLAGVNILIVDHQMGAATDLDGKFVISDVPVGTYQLKFSMMGYSTIYKNRIFVRSGAPTVLNIELEEEVGTTKKIVIKPTYFEEPEDAPLSSKSMDKEEIIAQPGAAQDVQRAMQALPAVVSGTDFDNEIIARGGYPGENQFLLDNYELPNPNYYAFQGTGGGPMSVINTDFIDNVDFFAGAFPARYGGKTSSVLDMHMREGLRDKFHFKTDFSATGLGGYVEGPMLNKKGSYLVSGHKSMFKLIDYVVDLDFVPNYGNIQGKLTYDFSPTTKLSHYFLTASDKLEINMDAVEDEDVSELEYATDQYTLGLNLKHVMNWGYANATLFRTSNHWKQDWIDSTDILRFKNNSVELTNKLKGSLTLLPTKSDEITIGGYAGYSEFNYDFYVGPDTLFLYTPYTDSIIGVLMVNDSFSRNQDFDTWSYGGYVQYNRDWGALFHTTLGLRYEGFEFTGNSYIAPRAAATYNLTANTEISAAFGRHYQQPQWYMLGMNGEGTKLDHYYTDQVVAGISHLITEDIKASVEVYYKKYNDVPVSEELLTDDPLDEEWGYVNHSEGYARGFELFLQKKVKDNLWGTLSYSFSESMEEDARADNWDGDGENPYVDYPKDFDYGHVLTAIVGYHHEFLGKPTYERLKKKAWFKFVRWIPGVPADINEYSLRFRYMGGRPYTSETYIPDLRLWYTEEGKAYNQSRYDDYARLDLRIQSRWFVGKRMSISSYFEVNNLLNRKNVAGISYNDDGTIEEMHQFPFLPSTGIIFEF